MAFPPYLPYAAFRCFFVVLGYRMPTGDETRERKETFKSIGLKERCPVCSKVVGDHCIKRLQLCYHTYLKHGGPRPYKK